MASADSSEAALILVKEIFFSLQGEGFHAGRAAVFIRFSGCNLWTGFESDRDSALCPFCDTAFAGTDGKWGGEYDDVGLAEKAVSLWPGNKKPFVVLSGGEPMLQVDERLVAALHERGCIVAVETNGTIPVPPSIDWITVSPKAEAPLRQLSGNELKLVYPQGTLDPARYEDFAFEHMFLLPLDKPDFPDAAQRAAEYCLVHTKWRLTLQMQKIVGIK